MKIRCPKCSHVISLGIAKLPSTGIEIQCPDCSARFRLRSKEGDSKDTPEPATPAPESAFPDPPAAPTPSAPSIPAGVASDIFGGAPQGMDDPFAPPPMAANSAQEAPPAPSGGGGALDGLADLLQELDGMPTGNANADTVMYQVRGQRGNIFGPFDAPTILGMLDNGQLTGAEDLSPDGQNWHPMGEWAEFQDKVATLQQEADPAEDGVSWEDEAPAPPPGAEMHAAAGTMGSPIHMPPEPQAQMEEEELEEEFEEEQEIRRIERKAPQRIRSALRDDVIQAEGHRLSLSDLPALKESLKSLDRKWIIMGAGGLLLVIGLAITAMMFLNKPKVVTYRDINIPLAGVFASDSHKTYLKQVIPKIKRMFQKEPNHPKLPAYRALSLAMYLEHYGPNKNMTRQMDRAIQKIPRAPRVPVKGKAAFKPTAVDHWARAMHAILKRNGRAAWKYSVAMKKLSPNHSAIPYLQARAQELSRRFPQALAFYRKAAGRMASPIRVHFAQGIMFLKWKKWERAFKSFYKVTLVSKQHYPAYLQLLSMENRFPSQKSRYSRLWKSAKEVFAKVKNPMIKSKFLYKQSLRASEQGKPNTALAYLLRAIRLQPNNRVYQRKLPDLYLSTYDYAKTIFFLRKMMSLKGQRKPGVVATFLQVLFRINKAKEARTRVKALLKQCPRCKKDHDFWIWRARVEEASQLQVLAIQSLNHALFIKKNSVAALAAKARNAWIANHPKITRKLLKKIEKLKPKTMLDRLNLTELYMVIKQDKKALRAIKPLLQTHPRDEYVNRLGGTLELKQKNYARAEKLFKRSLKTWGKSKICIRGLALVLEKLHKNKEAIPYYIKTIGYEPDKASNYFRVGRLFYLTKKYKKAATFLRKGLELTESNHEAHFYLGLAKEALGVKHTNVLIEHFSRALTMAPNNRRYLLKLAKVYLKANRSKEALQLFSRLLLIKTLPRAEKASVLLDRGKLLYDRKLWSYALKDFKKLYRIETNKTVVLRWIADCYRQMNRTRQATRWYKRTLRSYRKNKPKLPETGIPTPEFKKWKIDVASVYARLGDLYRSRNKLRKAIRLFKNAVRSNKAKYSYHRQLGYLYKDLKRWSRCVRHFKTFLRRAPKKDLDRAEVRRDLQACRDAQMGRY